MYNIFAWFFNSIEVNALREKVREFKDKAEREGNFKFRLSFYGNLKNPYDGKHTLVRIEVMSTEPFTPDRIIRLHEYFSNYEPKADTELFLLHGERLFRVEIEKW